MLGVLNQIINTIEYRELNLHYTDYDFKPVCTLYGSMMNIGKQLLHSTKYGTKVLCKTLLLTNHTPIYIKQRKPTMYIHKQLIESLIHSLIEVTMIKN